MATKGDTKIPEKWTPLTDEEMTGNGMRYVEHGWSHTDDPFWDVLVFRAEGEVGETNDKDWGVQYPTADDMDLFDSRDKAVGRAKSFMAQHPDVPE